MATIVCRLTIDKEREITYVDSYNQAGVKGEISSDPLVFQGLRQACKVAQQPNHERLCAREDYEYLGSLLYRVLFAADTSPVKRTFDSTYAKFSKASDARLQFILSIHRDNALLADYPWEFLFRPGDPRGVFFSGERIQLRLVRRVDDDPGAAGESSSPAPITPQPGPLRILPIVSSPAPLTQVLSDPVIEEMAKIPDVQILPAPSKPPNYYVLRDHLTELAARGTAPHVVHFMGHGKPGELALFKSEEEFKLEQATSNGRAQQVQWNSADDVVEIFKEKGIRLIFLHACDTNPSAPGDRYGDFKSLARRLTYVDIPAVIAMQFEISNKEAITFAVEFYKAVAAGLDLDEAVAKGRSALGKMLPVWGHRRFGTPVVYLQTEQPILLARPMPEANRAAVPSPPVTPRGSPALDRAPEPAQPRADPAPAQPPMGDPHV